jgi:hypothetical protein
VASRNYNIKKQKIEKKLTLAHGLAANNRASAVNYQELPHGARSLSTFNEGVASCMWNT